MSDYIHKPVKYVTPSRRIIVTYGNPLWMEDEFPISEEEYDKAEAYLKSPHKYSIGVKNGSKTESKQSGSGDKLGRRHDAQPVSVTVD